MKNRNVEIVFVDGPTGVGKDYLISKVASHIDSKRSVRVLRAADIVLEYTQSEERKYTSYETDTELLDHIYQGHIQLLETIREITENEVDLLVIVNRSFTSFLNYNLHEEDKESLKEEYISKYKEAFSSVLKGIPTLYISVTPPGDSQEETTSTILSRIINRNEQKDIDLQWISTLVSLYDVHHDYMYDIYTYILETTSDIDPRRVENIINSLIV